MKRESRNQRILNMRLAGATLAEIAEKFEISVARVQQILSRTQLRRVFVEEGDNA
jgi:DNA-directed RNA polymerase sigma subunit (sigma70/sigma32)